MRILAAKRRRRRRRALAALSIVLLAWMGWRAFRVAVGSPAAGLVDARWTQSTRVLARDGRLLGERASQEGLRGRAVPLAAISPRLVAATLASEDRRYWLHDGVDGLAVVRALVVDLWSRRVVSGGSTITAQLVKNLDHHGRPHPRTLRVKIVEMARAQNLEAELDKRTILEAYLNHLDYGHGLVGPEAAAQAYFATSARDLSLAQAALLAVIPRAPSALDPYAHLGRTIVRQRALLRSMRAHGEISAEDLDRALAEPIAPRERSRRRPVALHRVLSAATHDSGEVRTTLDRDLQTDVEGILRLHASSLHARGAKSAAVVVVDNDSGEILAEVGSLDWFDRSAAGAVDLARRPRQAGSTLKPFVYGLAFEKGMSPMQVLADVPTELGTTGAVYAPDNFDGTFSGPVPAREALAGSLNVPAVRLASELGARSILTTLRRAGLAIPGHAERYGLSIALGSAEVTPRDLAEAYATLARGGEHVRLRERLDEASGKAPEGERVIDAASAALIADALSDPIARVRGLHARGPFELPFPVAIKTGTSTAFRDAWTAGYTHERTVVVWVGNASGAPTNGLTGARGAGPIFFDVMKRAMRDVPSRGPLYAPELTSRIEVCALSGERPTEACPDRATRVFASGRAPGKECSMHAHAVVRAETASCDPRGDRVVVALPAPFDRFLDGMPFGAPGRDPHGLPWISASRSEGCGVGAGAPRVVLVKPRSGAVFHVGGDRADVLEIVAATEGLPSLALEVLVDGEVRASLARPYEGIVPIDRGDHTIEVRPHDPRIAARVAHAEVSVR